MNVIFDILILFFMAVCIASVLLLKNEGSHMIEIFISFIYLRNACAVQM
jgi:hypothetical protein